MNAIGPNRSFGLILTAVCAVLAVMSYRVGRPTAIIWASSTIVFLIVALTVPRVLAPARRGWLSVGHWLGLIVNPFVLGAVYAGMFIPVGLLMRLFGRDATRRKFDPAAASYWIDRNEEPAGADNLKEQF